ncbi:MULTISPECIES: septum formation initiator family protein [unclassified Cryobacterium]|uniref:FtsB family cell division protein n=1 Tax=unclassified Cryobacterium TaxID=2649013 RepID=UPI0014485EAC|nr:MULTISPECIES: septum formation initiator family protein [unclassified Cryobacterium]
MPRRERTQRVPVRLPQESAHARWLRSIRMSGFTIATLVVLVLTVVVLAPSLKVFIEQRQQIAQLEEQVRQQEAGVEELADEKARWDDPSYIETQARERLNYVYPGEYSYLVIDDGQTLSTQDGQPISDELQTTQVDWAAMMLSSFLTAGLSDAAPDELVAPVIQGSPGAP